MIRRAHRGARGGHGGSDAADQSNHRGRLCPPYTLRIVSKAGYESNFANVRLRSRRSGKRKLRHCKRNCAQTAHNACKRSEEARYLASIARRHAYNLVHLIYRPSGYEGDSKDYEFSRLSMAEHWRSGYYDALRTLRHPEVLARAGNGEELNILDFAGDSD